MARPDRVVVTCEHAGNRVPARWAPLFRGKMRLLESHRGYDPGALELARLLARRLDAPLFFSTTTRLLVEPNRSIRHPALFSEVTRALDPDERELILRRHWRPFRERVLAMVGEAAADGFRVVHVSVHTFTPVLDGVVRRADIGLLHDPARRAEAAFCRRWRDALVRELPRLRVLFNQPYRGVGDGHATALRRRFGSARYAGIELEVNQKHLRRGRAAWRRLGEGIARAFAEGAGCA